MVWTVLSQEVVGLVVLGFVLDLLLYVWILCKSCLVADTKEIVFAAGFSTGTEFPDGGGMPPSSLVLEMVVPVRVLPPWVSVPVRARALVDPSVCQAASR